MVQPEEEPLKTESKKRSLKERYEHMKQHITVEPVLACYVIPGTLARLATQNLYIDKACRVNLQYGAKVCDALVARDGKAYQDEEKTVQELVAGLDACKNIILTAIPSFLILFLGAWSDRSGKRKMCILLPIFGELLMCLSNIVNVYFFDELPVEVTMFFEAFFPAITGGWITTFMGAFSYISDMSSEETRTFRIGVANLCFTVGSPIGSALSGILLKEIGYYGVFFLSSVLYIFSISYGFFYIKDPGKAVVEKSANEPSGCWSFLKTFFATKHVKDTLTVGFKKGPNHRRRKSILVLLAIIFIYGPSYGEYTIRYLFCRSRFNWDALKYSFYSTFYICIHCIGAIISISIFSRRFKWDDSVLGLMSSLSKFAGGMATGFSRNSREMYIAVVIETFNATSFTALRSISSKLVTSDELGKMTSLFNLMEVVTSMIFGPVYSWIYMLTLRIDTGIAYYISTGLTIAPIGIFLLFFRQHRIACREEKKLLEQTSNPQPKEEDV